MVGRFAFYGRNTPIYPAVEYFFVSSANLAEIGSRLLTGAQGTEGTQDLSPNTVPSLTALSSRAE